METMIETKPLEKQNPLSLNPQPLHQEPLAVREENAPEKERYWNSLLTGDPATVPDEVWSRAGANDERAPEEERHYRLMSNINRSWVVDYKKMQKEQVRADWPDIRLNLARELKVRDTEQEVYAGLSLQQQEAPRRREVRELFEKGFYAGLRGEDGEEEQEQDSLGVLEEARRQGSAQRAYYMPLAEEVSDAWALVKTMETKMFQLPDVLMKSPSLLQAVDALADMDADERARVYAVARSLDSTRALEEKPAHLGDAMLHSMRRGMSDIQHGLVQGVGHLGTAMTKAAAETFDSDTLRRGAEAADRRLQVLNELRQVAQGELFPIELGEDSHLLEQLAVDVAGATPGAALAFMGGAGFGALTLAGTGAAVAEARQRSPKGRQELQTAAGIVGGALQASIYMGMSRLGANMLNRTLNSFAKAHHAGAKGYALASLEALKTLTAENAKLLLAGKAAHAGELGMQELAARVDKVASNIDWESFGDNIVDIEANMREAAMNLPFVLIASGRVALHHFRSPSAILENGQQLKSWGVDEATCSRILNEPDIHVQSDMLRDALRSSKRWGGAGALEDFIRSLKLLNTEANLDFRDSKLARDFLNMEADVTSFLRPEVVARDVKDPKVLQGMYEKMTGKKQLPGNVKKSIPYMLMWDEWGQKAHGVVPMEHAELKKLKTRYLKLYNHNRLGLPPYLGLNGYYHPYRREALRVIVSDRVREIVNNSYRLLMNSESLDSLMNSYGSLEEARERTELTRRMYVSEFCQAMMRCVRGVSTEESFNQFYEKMEQFYVNRRRGAKHAPRWMRQVDESEFLNMKDTVQKKLAFVNKLNNHHLNEYYRSLFSARVCGESLLATLPHTEGFQTLLSMGFSPEEAYSHLLQREFGGHVDAKYWNPAKLSTGRVNVDDNLQRLKEAKKSYEDYVRLSGFSMQTTTDGKGKKLYRIMGPDGRYSPWMQSAAYAVNCMVGNVQTSFLPTGKNMLFPNMNNSYRLDFMDNRIFERRRMFPLSQRHFTGFDHLGNTAARDLCAVWLGDATHYGVGLEFSQNDLQWKRYNGRRVNLITKEIEPDKGLYLVRHGRVITPMDLVTTRFVAYWNRMLLSGWVTPQEVRQTLEEANMVSSDTMDTIFREGFDRPVNLSRMSGPARRKYIAKHGRIVPGKRHEMYRKLANHMAELNVAYMLVNLQKAQLPNTVKQWFLTTPFSEFEEPMEPYALWHDVAMHSNRTSANVVKSLIPKVHMLRNLLKDGKKLPLESHMCNAYEANDKRRYEQGWCFSMGGVGAFRSAGQPFWNMLEDPVRAWKLLPEEHRQKLESEISEVCADRPVPEALQELSEVLQQYPELHAYGVETRGGNDLCRMTLNPVETENVSEIKFEKRMDARYETPFLVNNGFTMSKTATLPENCREDARVMPAIRLLTELRRQVTNIPYADDSGIWWKKQRYGGADGLRPAGLDERWVPETGLKNTLEVFNRLAEIGQIEGKDGALDVCGVSLRGIQPEEVDINRLKHITVYRCKEMPEHLVRLMPGELDAHNPYQRAPYILHTADGIPLLPTRMATFYHEHLQALSPLPSFHNDMKRSYDYDTNSKKRVRVLNYCVDELVRRRALNREKWDMPDREKVNNLELYMQLFHDSRLMEYLASHSPDSLTRAEALTCELARRTLLAEIGHDRDKHVQDLLDFCLELRRRPEEIQHIKRVLNRTLSPDPNHYPEDEVAFPENVEETPTEDADVIR